METTPSQFVGQHATLLALMKSATGKPIIVGRLTESIDAGDLLAIEIDRDNRPTIRRAQDAEIGIDSWRRPADDLEGFRDEND
jgi:hypothetical protein